MDKPSETQRKAHYFKLCYHEWTHGTRGLSLAERMFYLELCMWSFDRRKPLPLKPETLATSLGLTAKQWARYWPKVASKFSLMKAGYGAKRVKRDIALFLRDQRSKSEGGKRGAENRWSKQRAERPQAEETAIAPESTPPPNQLAKVNGNPHHKASNLINGADIRRHGSHAWCAFERDGLCVPVFLHKEFIGKSQKTDADMRAWYATNLATVNGIPVGEDALTFWRNSFAAWIGVATTGPANTAGARRSAQLRKSLAVFAAAHPTGRPI